MMVSLNVMMPGNDLGNDYGGTLSEPKLLYPGTCHVPAFAHQLCGDIPVRQYPELK
jgi:hypothetical protein